MITNTFKDLLPTDGEILTDRLVVINGAVLSPEYKTVNNQIWRAKDGFGCFPFTRGTAVYCESLNGSTTTRWERYDIIGIITEETAALFGVKVHA